MKNFQITPSSNPNSIENRDTQSERQIFLFTQVLAGIACLVGLLGFLGWFIDEPLLTHVVKGAPPIMPITTILLFILGLSFGLIFQFRKKNTSYAQRILRFAYLLIGGSTLLGAAVILEYAFHWDLGIDLVIKPQSFQQDFPGRPAPETAFVILLIGCSLLTRELQSKWGQYFSLITGILGLGLSILVLTGYFLGEVYLYSLFLHHHKSGMALNTAVGLVCLSVANLVIRSESAFLRPMTQNNSGGIVVRRLVFTFLFIPIFMGIIHYIATKANVTSHPMLQAVSLYLILTFFLILTWRTARKVAETEKKLQDSEELSRSIIELSPDPIFVANIKGQYIDVNTTALETFGFSRDEIIGKSIVDFIPSAEAERLIKSKKILMSGKSEKSEWQFKTKDGPDLPIEVNAKILPDGRWLGFVRDISHFKELERLREEWTSVVAHDLRQPVSIIGMAAGAIKEAHPDLYQNAAREIEIILSNAEKVNRMILDLLDASRIEGRHLHIHPSEADLNVIVENVLVSFRKIAPERQIITLSPPLESSRVYVDTQRIEQVLNNLLSNAVKYSEEDSPIEVSLERNTHEFRVSITNYGTGVTEDEISSLFQRFSRAKSSAGLASGIGLGLYIAKGLVEAHGGKIWVKSTPQGKTVFTFSLPQKLLNQKP